MKSLGLIVIMIASSVPIAGCAKDPVYIAPTPAAVEVGGATGPAVAVSTVIVPILNPTQADYDEHTQIAEGLMVAWDQVPDVRRDDLLLEVEWTIKNLDMEAGNATVSVVGANEWFSYDPNAFVVDPDEDAPPPPLMGGAPIEIPALGTVSGVFREDELSEAAQDLDALTRWGVTPERAMLTRWDTKDIVDDQGAFLWDGRAVPSLLQLDVSLAADRHMVLEFVLRVRDHSNRLAPNVTETWMLVTPAANGSYVPPPPVMP